MSYFHFLLATLVATLLPPAPAGGADARPQFRAAQALLLALLAALGREMPAPPLPHSPYAVPYRTPGPRTARHRGPVPPRACRLGRFTAWWARNRGARALPSDAPHPHPTKPARAPPGHSPISHQPPNNTPNGVRLRAPIILRSCAASPARAAPRS